MEQIASFRGSKYIQARVGNSFAQCKQLLDQGRPVLFSGSQCQIAGLLHFLRKPYPNLLAIDFVCHGIPSPKVWDKYLDEVMQAGRKAISDISFRNKRLGWKRFGFSLDYNQQQHSFILTSAFSQNPFMRAFLANIILRPCCYFCPSKGGRSRSDITIADFWGINKVNPQMFDDKGTSLVLIHNAKGQHALHREKILYAQASYEKALRYNPSIEQSAIMHPRRDVFFTAFCDYTDLHTLIAECLRPTKKQLIKKIVNLPLIICKRLKRLYSEYLDNYKWGGVKLKTTIVPTFDSSNLQLDSISFRSKAHGWRRYKMLFIIRQHHSQ